MSRGMSMTEAEYRALIAQRGQAPTSQRWQQGLKRAFNKPALPSLERQYPEAAFYAALQEVGQQHGWLCECSWLPHGEDQGLCCWLVRPPELIYALIRVAGRALTPIQAKWLAALRKTSAEVVEWSHTDVKAMTERLSRTQPQGGTLTGNTTLEGLSPQRSEP